MAAITSIAILCVLIPVHSLRCIPQQPYPISDRKESLARRSLAVASQSSQFLDGFELRFVLERVREERVARAVCDLLKDARRVCPRFS